VERAARAVLSDRSLVRRFDAIRELDRELVQLERAEASWRNTTVATNLNSEIGVTRALAVNEAGEIARKRVERLVNEFRVLITRVIKIEYEILQGEKGTLEETSSPSRRATPAAVRGISATSASTTNTSSGRSWGVLA